MLRVAIKNETDYCRLKKDIQDYVNGYHIQLYYPPVLLYTTVNTSLNELTSLKRAYIQSTYMIHKIHHALDTDHTFQASIKTTDLHGTPQIHSCEIFIKESPILNPYKYISGHYANMSVPCLPSYHQVKTMDKINAIENAAYIDALFSQLAGELVCQHQCPTFPLYYGTLSCMMKEYQHDVTEYLDEIRCESWFKDNLNRTFRMVYTNDHSVCSRNKIGSPMSYTSDIIDLESIHSLEGDSQTLNTLDEVAFSDASASTSENESDSELLILHESEEDKSHDTHIIELNHVPVQLIVLEKLDITFTEFLEMNPDGVDQDILCSILFQICFGLAVAQRKYSFVHNDLHADNIMFKMTEDKYLYYVVNNQYYRIPTYQKVVKIIDFGRAAFYHKGRYFISDVFSKEEDAEGQVVHPTSRYDKEYGPKPNPSFDLAFLATTIIDYVDDESPVHTMLKEWTKDKFDHYLYEEEDNFELCVKISKNIQNVIPEEQLNHPLFHKFQIPQHLADQKVYYTLH